MLPAIILRPVRIGARARRRMIPLMATMVAAFNLMAQTESGYIIRTAPYPVFTYPEPAQYNLKFGRMTARLRGSVDVELNDNINLSDESPEADVSIGPFVGIGFLWPLNLEHVLQLDVGFGYRWYFNHPAIQSVTVAPNSRFDYRIFIKDVKINLHDNISVQVDPTTRPELGGGDQEVDHFRVLSNVLGFIAEWRPMQPLGILAGYDFSIDRSLSDQFAAIDRNGHTFTAGGQYTLSPRVTAGLNGTYATTDYLRNVHNDAVTYSIGPVLAYELSSFVTIDAAAAYVLSNFEDTGTIGDQSNFSGFTVQLGVRHLINSRMSQDLRLRKGMELAFGANYLDLWTLQHTFSLELTSAITLQSRFVYELLEASIPGGETAERYLYYLGTTYQVTRIWSLGAGYSFAWKNSDLARRDYRQNRLAFTLTRQF